jgi:hypothetical protein
MKRLIIVLLSFFIVSCGTANYIWVPKNDVTNQQFNYDYGLCNMDAKTEASWAVGSSTHPNNLGLFDSIAWSETYNKTFNECMTKKGYNKVRR